jgi:hypothetical protein
MSCMGRPSSTFEMPVMSLFRKDQILKLPDLSLWAQLPYTLLPLPNVIDQWLLTNHIDTAHSNNIPNRLYSCMGDLLSDQVLCTLQLSAVEVGYYPLVCSMIVSV